MKNLALLLFSGMAGLAAAGCELFSGEAEFSLILPEAPPHWAATFDGLPAELVVVSPDNGRTVRLMPRDASGCGVLVPKKNGACVLFYPVVCDGTPLVRPYGAVFPEGFDPYGRGVSLTPAGGFVAERLANLARNRIPVGDFNAPRLVRLLEERGGDPWDYDAVTVETDIAAGIFNTYSLKKLPARDISLHLNEGSWFLESSFSVPVQADATGAVLFAGVTCGYHLLFKTGTPVCASLSVTENDVVVFWE